MDLFHESDYDTSDSSLHTPKYARSSASLVSSSGVGTSYASDSSISSYKPPKGAKIKPKKEKKKKDSVFEGLSTGSRWSGDQGWLAEDKKAERRKKKRRPEKPILGMGGLEVVDPGPPAPKALTPIKKETWRGGGVSVFETSKKERKWWEAPPAKRYVAPARTSKKGKVDKEKLEIAAAKAKAEEETKKVEKEKAELAKKAEEERKELFQSRNKVQGRMAKVDKKARERRNKRDSEALWKAFVNEPLPFSVKYAHHLDALRRRPASPDPYAPGYFDPRQYQQSPGILWNQHMVAPRDGVSPLPRIGTTYESPLQRPFGLGAPFGSLSGWRNPSGTNDDPRARQIGDQLAQLQQDYDEVLNNRLLDRRTKEEELAKLKAVIDETEDYLRMSVPKY